MEYIDIVSGAYHDAMVLGAAIPIGMIFVPSRGGISHSPLEYTTPAELERGLVNAHFHSPGNFTKGAVPNLPLELFMLYELPPVMTEPAHRSRDNRRPMRGSVGCRGCTDRMQITGHQLGGCRWRPGMPSPLGATSASSPTE